MKRNIFFFQPCVMCGLCHVSCVGCVMCHVPCVTCHMSPVTRHQRQLPQPHTFPHANCPTMHSRLVCRDQKHPKTFKIQMLFKSMGKKNFTRNIPVDQKHPVNWGAKLKQSQWIEIVVVPTQVQPKFKTFLIFHDLFKRYGE